MIRVVVVDDHGIVRDGLRAALESRPDLVVVGEAATGYEAIAVARSMSPDVIVMDLNLPDIDGTTATRQIIESGCPARILVLTMNADDGAVVGAIRAGARGYLLKDAGRDEIESAIRTLASGGTVLGPHVGDRFLESVSGTPRATLTPFPELTDRERDLLELLAQGRTNGDIARTLFLSEKTVRNRVSTVLTKLHV